MQLEEYREKTLNFCYNHFFKYITAELSAGWLWVKGWKWDRAVK